MSKNPVSEPVAERTCIRAKEGETMWVLLNHVKADKREIFERFMFHIIMPIVAHTEPEVLNKTRILNPTAANKDGTYTYIFLMDPLVAHGEYDFEPILKREYPQEKIAEYLAMFNDSLVVDQVEFVMTQSPW